jgi:probable rRNA maturation factor
MPCDIMLHAMIIIDPEANSSIQGRADAALALPALRLFLRRARKAVPVAGQVSVLLASDSTVKRLNAKFRGKNRPTDVISFHAFQMPAQKSGSPRLPLHPPVAGDLAISLEAAARQAQRFGHPVAVELKILMLHGLLHLAGYDHETDSGEMAAREEELRRRFRLPTTLIARTVAQPPSPKRINVNSAVRKAAARPIARRRRAGRP